MLFSSLVFITIFLPVVLLLYYVIRKEYRNTFLFISSMIFFAWGGVSYSALLIFSIIFNYVIGLLISKNIKKKKGRTYLVIGVVINLLFLGIFKYLNFFIENLNSILSSAHIEPVNNNTIILPIGISFYTFQAISYIVGIYKKEAEVQKKFINLAVYISLFPQLIAGPIVRYKDINEQLDNRKESFNDFVYGIQRFVIGLGKKILIANTFAQVADTVFAMEAGNMSSLTAWIGAISYSLQIYYDFSGYSDMAIGLARMFGFKLLENFNFPYISKSINEFWKRWHISLSSWFMNYLFLPLAYNISDKLKKNVYLNIKTENIIYLIAASVTFLLCGFWHGASWTFVVWGAYHGFFLIIERFFLRKKLKKTWKPIRHIYTLLILIIGWVFFRAETLSDALIYVKTMFVGGNYESKLWMFNEHFYEEKIFILILALVGSTTIFFDIQRIYKKWIEKHYSKILVRISTFPVEGFGALGLISIFLLCLMSLATNTYNPFIYFRF